MKHRADPIVREVQEVHGVPGLYRLHMECRHVLLRSGGDWTWRIGAPHPCEACINGESIIQRLTIVPGVTDIVATLECPAQPVTVHAFVLKRPPDLALPREHLVTALVGTTTFCPQCHPILPSWLM